MSRFLQNDAKKRFFFTHHHHECRNPGGSPNVIFFSHLIWKKSILCFQFKSTDIYGTRLGSAFTLSAKYSRNECYHFFLCLPHSGRFVLLSVPPHEGDTRKHRAQAQKMEIFNLFSQLIFLESVSLSGFNSFKENFQQDEQQ